VGSDNGAWVDIGVERPLPLKTARRYQVGQRLNVRVFSLKPLAAEPVDRSEIPHYWGYETEVIPNLDEHVRSTESLVGATSRQGTPATPDLLAQTVRQGRKRGLEVVFGSPARGVDAFLSSETMEGCCVINTIPHQGTETVRLEEAIFATLSEVNLMRSLEG
jgi:predicted SPOUT superfamily RNA methylase MTH1